MCYGTTYFNCTCFWFNAHTASSFFPIKRIGDVKYVQHEPRNIELNLCHFIVMHLYMTIFKHDFVPFPIIPKLTMGISTIRHNVLCTPYIGSPFMDTLVRVSFIEALARTLLNWLYYQRGNKIRLWPEPSYVLFKFSFN